jgi:hypothetical protein
MVETTPVGKTESAMGSQFLINLDDGFISLEMGTPPGSVSRRLNISMHLNEETGEYGFTVLVPHKSRPGDMHSRPPRPDELRNFIVRLIAEKPDSPITPIVITEGLKCMAKTRAVHSTVIESIDGNMSEITELAAHIGIPPAEPPAT